MYILKLTIALLVSFNVVIEAKDRNTRDRTGKLFSLFNIVHFKNEGCRSTSTLSSGGSGSLYRNGTCYTSSECSNKGGQTAGSCAAGFGVCCVFLISETGKSVNENCTYIRNPGFPNGYATTSEVSHTIQKCSPDVCYLRLDFEIFTIEGPTTTSTEIGGGICTDSFSVSTNTGQVIPAICGQNMGQHIYVDMGTLASDTSTVSFSFSGASTARMWEVKISQIPCGSNYGPRNGCLQYHTGLTGRMTTFNFIPTDQGHLKDQSYTVCIRPEAGFCCIQYSVCADASSFSLSPSKANQMMPDGTMLQPLSGSSCSTDYVEIPGSSGTCVQGSQSSNNLNNKYCGDVLNGQAQAAPITINVPVCDCTAPYELGIVTNAKSDIDADADTANLVLSRGLCLEWTQIPCSG